MLILSRKPKQSIVINNNIIITIVHATSSNVRIGIEAPKDVPIFREEIFDVIASQKAIEAKELP